MVLISGALFLAVTLAAAPSASAVLMVRTAESL